MKAWNTTCRKSIKHKARKGFFAWRKAMKKADKAPKKRSVLKGSKTATVLEMIFSLMTIPLAL